MPSKRQQLAEQRNQVGGSATPVNVTTDHLTAVMRPLAEDGSFVYTPDAGFHGTQPLTVPLLAG